MANEVTIEVGGRDAGARAALTSGAQAADQLAGSVGRAGDVARGVLAAGFIQQIGQKAQQFLGDAASAAAGLEQAVGGTRAVFGDASGAVDDFARRSARAVGLSEQEFRDATTLIGGQLKRMTGDVGLAADASIQLVQVGADLAATYGGTTREAVDAFAAALRGEADPAERFNLNLKISAVNAKAVELGLAESADAVDENARAQALLALVLDQSADAQGQFAREADTAAVAQQKAAAQWENAKAVLGGALLPVISQASNAVSILASGFQELPDPVQTTIAAVATLAAGLLIVLPRIAAAKVALAEMGVSMRSVAVRGGSAVGVLTALVTAAALVGSQFKATGVEISGLTKDIERFLETGRVTVELERVLGGSTEEFLDKLREARGVAHTMDGALERMGQQWDKVLESIGVDTIHTAKEDLEAFDSALIQVVESGADADDILSALVEKYHLTDEQVGHLLSVLPKFKTELDRTEEAQTDAAAATEDHLDSLKDLADQLRAQTDPMFKLIEAQENLRDAQRAATEAIEEHDRGSPEHRAALRDEARAALEVLEAAGELGDEFTGRLSRAQRRMLRDAGLSEDAIERLAADLRRAKRDAERLDGTRVRIQEQHTIIITTINRQITQQFGPNAPQAFAHGGIAGGLGAGTGPPGQSAQAGGPRGGSDVLVGEQGEEVVELPFGTRVIPAGQTRAMLREAREALAAARSGRLFEDFSFRGGGREAFNDFFADWFFGGGGRFNRREVIGFLRDVVDELDRPARPDRVPGFRVGAPQPLLQPTAQPVDVIVHVYMDGREFRGEVKKAVRFERRTDAAFRAELASGN